jgi:ectoine hydroxylase-related dioxygenase (phytanoyl-CoA dioxygenase family)
LKYSVTKDGFSMVEGLLAKQEVEELIGFVERNMSSNARRGGVRNILNVPRMRELAESPAIMEQVKAVLGSAACVVRGILFDKTEDANWKVPWHQDVTIAVSQRVEAQGFGPWSLKDGILHVQPPAAVLEKMVSVRLHLDDCPAENGALRIIAGSHASGKLSEQLIRQMAEQGPEVICAMRSGGVLVMRPLLFHASSAASTPGHRRVIHFDYAAVQLPSGMNWAASQA